MSPEVRKGVWRFIFREYFGTFFVGVLLFWPAGTLNWPAGWLLVALYFVWVTATIASVAPVHPELLAERAKRRLSDRRWDQIILSLFGVLVLAKYLVAAFDFRYGWSGPFSWWLQGGGLLLGVIGYGLVTWSMTANAYFDTTARLQPERQQKVVSGGPYRFVRHPGYVGTILFEIGGPLLLGSWWALLLGLANAILMVIRTAYEDRMLRAELDGYDAFARQTPYRLIPGLW